MAKVNLNTIKNWFRTGLKPTQNQFWDTWDSFWHKDEVIPITKIDDIENILNQKADTEVVHFLTNKISELEAVTEVNYDTVTAILTINFIKGDQKEIQLSLDNYLSQVYYEETTQQLVFTMFDGTEHTIDITEFVVLYEVAKQGGLEFNEDDKLQIKKQGILESMLEQTVQDKLNKTTTDTIQRTYGREGEEFPSSPKEMDLYIVLNENNQPNCIYQWDGYQWELIKNFVFNFKAKFIKDLYKHFNTKEKFQNVLGNVSLANFKAEDEFDIISAYIKSENPIGFNDVKEFLLIEEGDYYINYFFFDPRYTISPIQTIENYSKLEGINYAIELRQEMFQEVYIKNNPKLTDITFFGNYPSQLEISNNNRSQGVLINLGGGDQDKPIDLYLKEQSIEGLSFDSCNFREGNFKMDQCFYIVSFNFSINLSYCSFKEEQFNEFIEGLLLSTITEGNISLSSLNIKLTEDQKKALEGKGFTVYES